MRILILTDVFFPDTVGGAGRVAYHLSNELSLKEHEIHVITRNTEGNLPDHQEIHRNLIVHRFLSTRKESFLSFLSEIKNTASLNRYLTRDISFDLVCTHQSLVSIGPLMSSSLRNTPIIHYFHSPWHEEFLIKIQREDAEPSIKESTIAFLMKKIERQVLRKADKVIVLSRFMLERVSKIHSYPKTRLVQIPGGVDLNRYCLPIGGKHAVRDILGLSQDKTVFLTVRNLVPRMGLENLIEAFNQSDMIRDKGLLLIGGKGFLEESLKKKVRDSALHNTVRFLGHIPEEDLPQMYQASDFFVLPTIKLEGFGLVILEAMASGTPVLGTPIGGIPEVIGPFDRELLFDGIGWQQIKSKIEEVIHDTPRRLRWTPQACRDYVEKNFSWHRVVNTFEQVAKSLIKEGK
ncbi:MAG: glycosyltransferase family 4 protein [Deltaproteobacteria bacterium]|nr:glycosyltransferase family 4 protein [Deltaproteobacteria bacterium]